MNVSNGSGNIYDIYSHSKINDLSNNALDYYSGTWPWKSIWVANFEISICTCQSKESMET